MLRKLTSSENFGIPSLRIFLHYLSSGLLVSAIIWIIVSPKADAATRISVASLVGFAAIEFNSFEKKTTKQVNQKINEQEDEKKALWQALEMNETVWELAMKTIAQLATKSYENSDLWENNASWQPAIKAIIHSLKEGLPASLVSRELSPYLTTKINDRVESMAWELGEYIKRIEVCQELSLYLEAEGTQERLMILAKEACDYVIRNNEFFVLERENLYQEEKVNEFYRDFYIQLRVWMKNNIKYDMALPGIALPAIDRTLQNDRLYVEGFIFLESLLDKFIDPTYSFQSSREDLRLLLCQHLEIMEKKVSESFTWNPD